jgi:predicted dehydrogenase
LGKEVCVESFSDPAVMIEEFRPELVIVALAANLAPPWIHQALSVGCDVLTEKPSCVRPEDFAVLVKLASEKRTNLMLALPSRMTPVTKRAKEIIDTGLLGKLYGVTCFQVKDQDRLTHPSYHDSWFAFREKAGGGHMIWLGIHDLDRVLFLTNDRVAKVTGFVTNVGGQPIGVEDAEAVSFQFQSGIVGTFQGGYYLNQGSFQAGTTIWGSSGWLQMSSYRDPEGEHQSFRWYSTRTDAARGVQQEEVDGNVDSYQLLVQAAVDVARGARPTPLTGEDCLHVLSIIFGAYRAAETGVTQSVD